MIPPVPDDLKSHVEAVRQRDPTALLALADRLYERGPETIAAALASLLGGFVDDGVQTLTLRQLFARSKSRRSPTVITRINNIIYLERHYWPDRGRPEATVADLLSFTAFELLSLRNFGRGSLNAVSAVLAEFGLSLPAEQPPP